MLQEVMAVFFKSVCFRPPPPPNFDIKNPSLKLKSFVLLFRTGQICISGKGKRELT